MNEIKRLWGEVTEAIGGKTGIAVALGLTVLAFVMAVAAYTVIAIWFGYVLHMLWGWFVVPAFGLPVLEIPVAIGIALIVALVAKSQRKSEDVNIWHSFTRPAMALVMGYITKQFI